MSPIIMRYCVVLCSALLLLSTGCSKERTPRSLINPDTGKHSAQWETPAAHGAAAKGAAASTTGFATCQECHGSDFVGGISKTTCLNTAGCHGAGINAPHAHAPWRGGAMTHTNTDADNASICATCHTNGANSSVHPSPFDPGAAPGCFNNTLCHAAVGHPSGWALPSAHGAAAKATPGATTGFSLCQTCHGNNFAGGVALKTCLNTAGCHGVGLYAPHAAAWLPGSTYTHTTTDQGNAPVCALCHTNGLNSPIPPPSPPAPAGTPPGCFNNTLCHAVPAHANPSAWALPSGHGTSAKAAPNVATMSGFSTCQICHGSNFSGGISTIVCYSCHGGTAPHPTSWMSATGTYTHTTTDPGNAAVCTLCHTNGANSPITPPSPAAPAGTTPGCFNNTLCHGAAGHAAGWSLPTAHGASAKAAPNSLTMSGFSTCQPCHGSTFTGGVSNTVCSNCHGGSAPHPVSWVTGTYIHTNTDQGNATVCALCHTNGLNSPIPPPSPPAPAGTPPGCFNNTLCHAQVGAPHAVPFTDPALHGPLAKADLTYCQTCHANPSNGGAGSNPRFNVPKGSLATGCEAASCHATNTAHPSLSSPPASPWRGFTAGETGHMTAGNMANACALCHGVNLVGGVGPACTSCHTFGSPLTLTNCTSCHGNPPNGTIYPNATGKHSQHNALGAYIVCAACHNGGGTGTANHDNGNISAFVAFLSAYNAKSGAASYNASTNTCSNVSCHGAQTTPGWLSGTVIDVNTQCTSCHQSRTTSDQYNSYWSGQHSSHVSFATCTECHDTTKLTSVHFTDLNTTAMISSYLTISSGLNYTGTATVLGTCTFTCHYNNENHNGRQW